MDPETINQLVDIGFAGGLIFILVAGFRGWWRYGPQVDQQVADLTADRDFWRSLALSSQRLAERATEALPPGGRDAE